MASASNRLVLSLAHKFTTDSAAAYGLRHNQVLDVEIIPTGMTPEAADDFGGTGQRKGQGEVAEIVVTAGSRDVKAEQRRTDRGTHVRIGFVAHGDGWRHQALPRSWNALPRSFLHVQYI